MKVVFAIDERGQNSEVAEMLKLAVTSCKARTSLEPVVIADGFRPEFRAFLEDEGVSCLVVNTPMRPHIESANLRSGYPMQAIGNYLRYEACNVISDAYFLYCDCDVIFLSEPVIENYPPLVAAVAEDSLSDWSRVNSGVLLVNRAALLAILPEFYDFAAQKLEKFYPGFDQAAFNAFFAGRIDHLSPLLNWRAYWGREDQASILHTHGVKPSTAEKLLQGIYNADRAKQGQIQEVVAATLVNLPSFAGRMADFASTSVGGRWLRMAEEINAFNKNPLLAMFDRLQEVRKDAASQAESSERAGLSRLIRKGEFVTLKVQIPTNYLSVRLLIDTGSTLLAASDLRDSNTGEVFDLDKSLMANVNKLDAASGEPPGWKFLSKVNAQGQVDIVSSLPAAGDAGRVVEFKVAASALNRVKTYWSQNGVFSEEEALVAFEI